MPVPYSYDLRRKAIEAVKRGEPKIEVSKMFNISRNTLDLWLNRQAETGDCEAITNYQNGGRGMASILTKRYHIRLKVLHRGGLAHTTTSDFSETTFLVSQSFQELEQFDSNSSLRIDLRL